MMMKKENTQGVRLTKSNQRWAWMAGATAAAAAVAPHALGATAQISLVGNTLDSATGNHLSDSTSAGHPFGTLSVIEEPRSSVVEARLVLEGDPASNALLVKASASNDISFGARVIHFNTATAHDVSHFGGSPQTAFTLIPFTLSDPTLPNALNGSNAFLEIEAFNNSATDQTVALLAIFYTESSTTQPLLSVDETTGVVTGGFTNVGSSDGGVFSPVPEPSSLALLALGAGGILARRKRCKAA